MCRNTTQLIDIKLRLEAQLYFMVIEKAQQLPYTFGSNPSDTGTCEHCCRSIIGGIGSVVKIRVCAFRAATMAPEIPQSGNDEEDSGASQSQHSRDEHESQSQSDSSKTHSTGPKAPQKSEEERARDERKRQATRKVNLVRLICSLVFVAAAAAVCAAMFKFTSANEHSAFELEVSCP